MGQAYIDTAFSSNIDAIKENSRTIYRSTLLNTSPPDGAVIGSGPGSGEDCHNVIDQRKWHLPANWTGGIFDIADINAAFDRQALNDAYIEALTDGEGVSADCQTMKIQIDHIASQERAFRMRHASSIRCKIHAAVRRRGQSQWNDATEVGEAPEGLAAGDVTGPVGGVMTSLVRYLSILMADSSTGTA